MAVLKSRGRCCVVLLCFLYLGYTTATEGIKKHKHCIHIVSINSPSDDPAKSIYNYAFQANVHKALLGAKPGLFRIKDRGFLGIDGTVAIESAKNPGYYLRQKNYKFHLQKTTNSSIFAKDATFYLLKVQKDPPLYAFELYGHPSWFIMHKKGKKNKKNMLILGHVKGSEHEVMDSTFSLKEVHCHPKRKGTVQKKTVVLGHGTLMEDQSDDDDLNDVDYIEEFDGEKAIEGKAISIKESGSVAQKEKDVIHEVEQAFNATNSKKSTKILDVMEKDIEGKVSDIASSLYKQNDLSKMKNTYNGDTNLKDTDVVIDDNDLVTNNINTEKQTLDDVIIKTEGSSTKNRVPEEGQGQGQGKVTPDLYGEQVESNKPTFLNKKSMNPVNAIEITTSDKSSVVKGSPKLVNEHYDIIARTSLGIPEGYKDKIHNKVLGSNNEAGYKHNMIISEDHNQRLQTKVDNMKQLFGNLGKSVHVASGEKSLIASTMKNGNHFYNSVQKNDRRKFTVNETQTPLQDNLQPKLNRMRMRNGRPVVYFSEKCQNALPNVCEVWAQKRYCLAFNELMKRYCRKSCGLCDPIVTTGFSPCDKLCGGGIRLRMIKVNNRQVLQRRACNTHNCPIDGGYTPFSSFSECSATCGKGLRYKHRTCTQPPAQYGGKECARLGSPIKTVKCHVVKCKGLQKHLVSNKKIGKKVGKVSHSQKQVHDDYEHMPEYQMEKLSKGYTVNIDTPKKINSAGTLKYMKGNMYQYFDSHGKKKLIVQLKGKHSKSPHNHHVYHKGQQVANIKCGASKFPKYHEMEPNSPLIKSSLEKENSDSGEGNPYKMYESGKLMYDKYGMPSGTTEEIVKSSDSPYKIILHKNKNSQMVVSEECLESDSSVNPDDVEDKNFQKPSEGYYGSNYEDSTQSYGTSNLIGPGTAQSYGTSNLIGPGTAQSYGTSNLKGPGTAQSYGTSNLIGPGTAQSYGQGTALGNEVTQAIGSIGRAIDDDTDALSMSSLMQKEAPKLTLSEELAAENEEALKERQYEENIADKSSMQYAQFRDII